MDFDEYQTLAKRTANFAGKTDEYALMYLCLGLAGETGEVIEKMKKVVRNDGGVVSDEKREDIKRELGDVLWYASQLADRLGIPFNTVAEANITKLADRAARHVIASEGDTR